MKLTWREVDAACQDSYYLCFNSYCPNPEIIFGEQLIRYTNWLFLNYYHYSIPQDVSLYWHCIVMEICMEYQGSWCGYFDPLDTLEYHEEYQNYLDWQIVE